MTSKEFVIWLKGFVAGSNNFNLTPAGWESVKEELEKVNDYPQSISVGVGGWGTLTTSSTTQYPSGSSITYTNSNEKVF